MILDHVIKDPHISVDPVSQNVDGLSRHQFLDLHPLCLIMVIRKTTLTAMVYYPDCVSKIEMVLTPSIGNSVSVYHLNLFQ